MKYEKQSTQLKIKYKTYSYRTTLEWTGGRTANVSCKDKPKLRVSSPVEFSGEEGVWSPEEMFIAAVDACIMTTFLALAGRLKIPLISYSSDTEGVAEFIGGAYQFTSITARPTVVVQTDAAAEQARETIQDAHKRCLISNSVKASVRLDPKIDVWDP